MTSRRPRSFETSWGANYAEDGTRFRLWAPSAETVELVSGPAPGRQRTPMEKRDGGWWEIRTDIVPPGSAYGFRVDGGDPVPDPAARAQMNDVHGLSKLVDPGAYHWRTDDWKGRPWHEVVFYELHVGTFTPVGTFDGIIGKLDHLRETGVTAIEIMPVAQFGGRHGWGYDGVLLYCPHAAYGGPEGLKRLVDAAHERDLMVFLDVVYNHFGPDGNYISSYAPEFFHADVQTPWGAAIAYDEEPVRRFMIENALYWLTEFRMDGLRLDAINSIKDTTDVPLVRELAARVRDLVTDRHVHITTEDDRNITWHIERRDDGSIPLVSGEWNDDFHHAAHVIATNEQEGYYQDFEIDSAEQLARALATGFVFQGQYSPHREHEVGDRSGHLPPTAFVQFIQNHDQIGNRAFGDRLRSLSSARAYDCMQAILLLAPQIPFMFQGDEFGDPNSFCFFTDFHGELGEAVSKGRKDEFRGFSAFEDERAAEVFPDPNAEETFLASKLDWSQRSRPLQRRRFQVTKELLRTRRDVLMPLLAETRGNCGSAVVDGRAFTVTWELQSGTTYHLLANLDDTTWQIGDGTLPGGIEQAEVVYANHKLDLEDLRNRAVPAWTAAFLLARSNPAKDAATPDRLDELATSHGIQTRYTSEQNEHTAISDGAKRALLRLLDVDPETGNSGDFARKQHEATRRCVVPDSVRDRRGWGLTCQLYGLRSSRNLGIGDFEDLAQLAETAADAGAAFLGVNPLHALFLADPTRISPYSPSTRQFLNPLYIAVDRIPGGAGAISALRAEDAAAFADLDGDLVAYDAVASLKVRLLRHLFDQRGEKDEDRFEAFRKANGDSLRSFALFEAISAHMVLEGGHAGWQGWPGDMQHRGSEAVARFEAEHEEDIRFHTWLQFVADQQLAQTHARARAAGMRIGLYLDFAVGVAPDGSDTWRDPELTVRGARVGSPPDLFNSEGQDWGLAPLSPKVLAARDYEPLADAYDALMRHAGAIRIDHAMGLVRLWWIPTSGTTSGGGYVRYPAGAMIDVVAERSEANRCIVIGEDLGTVPEGFRSTMEAANILSYRVLYFERDESGEFIPPWEYPELALASISTHDLATLSGWWSGDDISLRAETGRLTEEATERDREDRQRQRSALLAVLDREGLLPAGYADIMSGKRPVAPVLEEDLAVAVHRLVARARSMMFAVQLEDAVLSARQPNLPGTVSEYPSWRIRYEVPIEELAADARFQAITRAVREERPEVS